LYQQESGEDMERSKVWSASAKPPIAENSDAADSDAPEEPMVFNELADRIGMNLRFPQDEPTEESNAVGKDD